MKKKIYELTTENHNMKDKIRELESKISKLSPPKTLDFKTETYQPHIDATNLN